MFIFFQRKVQKIRPALLHDDVVPKGPDVLCDVKSSKSLLIDFMPYEIKWKQVDI